MDRIANLISLISTLQLNAQIHTEVADILSELHTALYGLKEDNKRLQATVRAHDQTIQSLQTRYSELLYKISSKE